MDKFRIKNVSTRNIQIYKKDIDRLISSGEGLSNGLIKHFNPEEFERQVRSKIKDGKKSDLFIQNTPDFISEYQPWYSEAMALIRQILPDRLGDFRSHYDRQKARKFLSYGSYVISDALQGLHRKDLDGTVICDPTAAIPHLQQQIGIVRAAKNRFESSLFDIKQLVQADIFDSELSAATELLKRGFVRAAGAVAGVVLEKHLAQVCENHEITIEKKNPTIADFNDKLKSNEVVDIPGWRLIQLLGDLRNLCDHNKDREPTKEDGEALITGANRVIKSLF